MPEPVSPRERIARPGPGLEIYLSILREAMAPGEPRTLSEVFADRLDALLATRREGHHQGPCPSSDCLDCMRDLASDTAAQLATATARVAALEGAAEEMCTAVLNQINGGRTEAVVDACMQLEKTLLQAAAPRAPGGAGEGA